MKSTSPPCTTTKQSVLIVGGGSIGERHVRCWQRTGRSDVILCESNENRAKEVAERYGIRWESNFAQVLEKESPACIVLCTPAPAHVPMALQALEHGSHVLMEKPLSVDMHQRDTLAEAAKDHTVAVAYVWRMHPAIRRAKQHLAEGSIGRPLHAVARCGQDFATLRPGYENTYYSRHDLGGGAIQDGLTHVANAIEMLLGPTTSVFCEADHLGIPGVEVEDVVGVVARNDKAITVYSFSQTQKPNEFTIDIHGETGSLRIDLSGKRIGVFSGGCWSFEDTSYDDHDVLFTAQADAFLDAVERKAPPGCTLAEGIHTLRFNLACLESARTGSKVQL